MILTNNIVYDRGYKEHGLMNGYEYVIHTPQFAPCCYIIIGKKDPFYDAVTFNDINLRMHGGCTYFKSGREFFQRKNIQHYSSSEESKVIGWDFGHYGDWTPFMSTSAMESFKQTTKQHVKVWDRDSLLKEIEEVILQIHNLRHWEGFYE